MPRLRRGLADDFNINSRYKEQLPCFVNSYASFHSCR